MIWLIYYSFIRIMVSGIRFSCLWNKKARLWIQGRKNWRQEIKLLPPKANPRIWFHVSSLGEFEQARPVMEEIRNRKPKTEIILTFFSPSGYEIRKGYPEAKVLYLPADLPGNAAYWLSVVNPDIAVFVKYDTWPGYLNALTKAHIPFILISAHFSPDKWFSSWSIPPSRFLLRKGAMIFLQQNRHVDELRNRGFTHVQVAGDTRVDRVLELPDEAKQNIPEFFKRIDKFDLVAGSTWPADEKILIPVIGEMNLRVIIAPHDVSAANIKRLTQSFPYPYTLFSKIEKNAPPEKIVIVDTIGILAMLYALCPLAYIGGGFGKGIHNILEPMAHGIPVIFGPRYQRFPEAEAMVDCGGCISIKTRDALRCAIDHFRGPAGNEAGSITGNYIRKHAGATELVASYLLESIPFEGK